MQPHPELEAAFLIAIVASSNDAIITKTLDGVITSWNGAATKIFGYQPEEIIGRHITTIIPIELRAEEDEIISRLKRGEPVEHFDTVRQTKTGAKIPISLTISPVKDGEGRIIGASKIARDISERKRSEERQRLLMHELKHRVKNTLSTVRAIAGQTYNDATLARENAAFSERIAALAASCDLLIEDDWNGARPHDLIDAVLKPFRPSEDAIHIVVHDERELSPQQSNSLALAINELATNATKYGALSQLGGRVHLRWERSTEPTDSVLFEWIERGGPPVAPPQRKGFGTQVLGFALKHEMYADTEMKYLPEGLEFRMRF